MKLSQLVKQLTEAQRYFGDEDVHVTFRTVDEKVQLIGKVKLVGGKRRHIILEEAGA